MPHKVRVKIRGTVLKSVLNILGGFEKLLENVLGKMQRMDVRHFFFQPQNKLSFNSVLHTLLEVPSSSVLS